MAGFLFGKKAEVHQEKAAPCCCCAGDGCCESEKKQDTLTHPSVKILGGGCAKCNALEAATLEALQELGMDTAIEHVKDYTQIAAYGVMSTPALVVDEKVLASGRVLTRDEIVKLLTAARG